MIIWRLRVEGNDAAGLTLHDDIDPQMSQVIEPNRERRRTSGSCDGLGLPTAAGKECSERNPREHDRASSRDHAHDHSGTPPLFSLMASASEVTRSRLLTR